MKNKTAKLNEGMTDRQKLLILLDYMRRIKDEQSADLCRYCVAVDSLACEALVIIDDELEPADAS